MELAFDKIDDLLELVSQRLVNVDFQQIGDSPFHSRFHLIVATPDIRAVRTSHSPGLTFRDNRLVKDGDEFMVLVYPVNCSITVSQFDRERRLTPGHSALLRHDTIAHIGSRQNCRFMALVMPPSTQKVARLANNRVFAECWLDDAPALKLLKAYVATLAALPNLMQDDIAASAGRHIADLIRLAADEMAERPVESEPMIAGARLEVALACLRSEFRNPDLSVASVAAAQGISPRYLHRLLEQVGIRFTDYLNEVRLSAACTALVENRGKPVAVIALDSGFSDIAHFNRLFKKRFSVTPSAVRGRKAEE